MQVWIISGIPLSTASPWPFSQWRREGFSPGTALKGTQNNSGSSPVSEEMGVALFASSQPLRGEVIKCSNAPSCSGSKARPYLSHLVVQRSCWQSPMANQRRLFRWLWEGGRQDCFRHETFLRQRKCIKLIEERFPSQSFISHLCVCTYIFIYIYINMVRLLLSLTLAEEVFLLLQVFRYFQGHREKPCGIRSADIKCRGYSTSFDLWGLKCNFWLQPTFRGSCTAQRGIRKCPSSLRRCWGIEAS